MIDDDHITPTIIRTSIVFVQVRSDTVNAHYNKLSELPHYVY